MDRGWAVLLTAVVGGLIAAQAPINSMLGKAVGSLQAAVVSFVVGTLVLIALTALVGGGFGSLGEARTLPWYAFLGGVLGACYVASVLVTVRSLGAGGVTAATIAGQLTASLVLDAFGALGLERHPITWTRALGVALLAAGTFLIIRDY
jgi:bacterial/archaeal transporter family-2 protein